MAAGRRMPRTIVASSRMAAARPTPSIFSSTWPMPMKMEKTATMMSAALETTPALLAMPAVTAPAVVSPRRRSSLILLKMKTW